MKEIKNKSLIKPWILLLSAILLLIFTLSVASLVLSLTKEKEENSSDKTKVVQDWNSIVREYYYNSNTQKGKLNWETDFFGKNDAIVSFQKKPLNETSSLKVFDQTLLAKNQIYKFLATKMGIINYQKIKFYNSFVIKISTNVNNLFGFNDASQLEFEIKNEQLIRQNLLNKNSEVINQKTAPKTPYSVRPVNISNDAEAKKIGYKDQKTFQNSKFKVFLLGANENVNFDNYQLGLLLNLEDLTLKAVIKTAKTDGKADASLKIQPLSGSNNKGGIVWKAKYYYPK